MPATQENQLAMVVYAPALTAGDGRPLAVIHGMERAVPGLRIGLMISDSPMRRSTWKTLSN
jgi:hypothetical protein